MCVSDIYDCSQMIWSGWCMASNAPPSPITLSIHWRYIFNRWSVYRRRTPIPHRPLAYQNAKFSPVSGAMLMMERTLGSGFGSKDLLEISVSFFFSTHSLGVCVCSVPPKFSFGFFELALAHDFLVYLPSTTFSSSVSLFEQHSQKESSAKSKCFAEPVSMPCAAQRRSFMIAANNVPWSWTENFFNSFDQSFGLAAFGSQLFLGHVIEHILILFELVHFRWKVRRRRRHRR